MEYAKSVRSALRPRTLFASVCPVLISVSLLRKSHHISFLQLEVVAVLSFAILTQLMGNLSAVYSNFHRLLQPKRDGDGDAKIVLNLLSLTQVRRWSFLFYALQLLVLGVAHALCDKSFAATGGMVMVATLSLIYCRSGEDSVPIVGLKEAIVAWAVGPMAMMGAALYVVGEVPWAVVMYAYIVMLFVWAFLVLQSARDAPFARSMGRAETSVALRLGFQWSFQGFLLLMVSCYGLLMVLGLALGHLGNLLLLVSIVKLKDMSEDFRLERLNHLPDQFARLAAALGVGLIISITLGLS
ncbi:hypothetical protein PHYBOEH_011529 [Phytophthora boehmeriae]|uniref:1,4-dihydroxy-2-naphthoate octaprenyltransferase n=1 Tax=Phytophthora boehmeriae TaxID=109152 RepID=A0A8T1VJ82_9STRA|nr:hypothetical protein PHYBOEH_011529 [Phytophthora boehmeriae]